MSNFQNLKNEIANTIKANGNNDIDGALLQEKLLEMVDSLGKDYKFRGVATPDGQPITDDTNVFYVANTVGTYPNYGGLSVADGEIAFFTYNGSWGKITISELAQELGDREDIGVSQKCVTEKMTELESEVKSKTDTLDFDSQILVFEPQNDILTKKQLVAPYLKKGRKYRLTFLNKGWDISGVTSSYNGFAFGYIPKGQEILDVNYKELVAVSTSELNRLLQDYYDIEVSDDWEFFNIELRASEKVYIRCEDITRITELKSELEPQITERDSEIIELGKRNDELETQLGFDAGLLVFEPQNDILTKKQLLAPKVRKGRTYKISILNKGWDISGVTFQSGVGFGVGYFPKGSVSSDYVNLVNVLVRDFAKLLDEYIIEVTDDWEMLNIEVRASERVYVKVEDITDVRKLERVDASSFAYKPAFDGKSYGNNVAAPFVPYFGYEQKVWGRKLVGVKVRFATGGTFSVVKVTNVGVGQSVSNSEISTIETFNVAAGLQTLYFTEDVVLNNGEYLGFQTTSDTAAIWYENDPTTEGGINFVFSNGGKWTHLVPADLQIGVIVDSCEDSFLRGKSISIIGDSISTFNGKIPSNNVTFYPSGDITSYDMTWWRMLVNLHNARIEKNESSSGSRVTTTPSGTGAVSFVDNSRLNNLGNPNVIFVFGGTNDFGQSSPAALGEYVTSGTKDLTKFRPAYQYLVEQLISKYPKAEIVLLVPMQRSSFGLFNKNTQGWSFQDLRESVITIADMYGLKYIDLTKCGINQGNTSYYTIDGLHPNSKGMIMLAEYIDSCL
jgi:lysophospholipase L1-like esterase